MRPSIIVPSPLLKYPGTPSQGTLSYIQRMLLSTYPGDQDMDETSCGDLQKYISSCLDVLVAAESVQYLHLDVHIYDLDDCIPALRSKLIAINDLVFRIIRHAEKMNLRKLGFGIAGENADDNDVLCLIERKVNIFVSHAPLEGWVDRLLNFQNMTIISVFCGYLRYDDESAATSWATACNKFWIAISQMKNITEVHVDSIVISPALNLQLSHLTRLDLDIWWPVSGRDLANAFIAVFTQMPNLEFLHFQSDFEEAYHQEVDALNIGKIACHNLRDIDIVPLYPQGLMTTIVKQNPDLTSIVLDGREIDFGDEDIRCLSKYKRLRTLKLQAPTSITNLAHLTNLPHLDKLNLHYSMGKYMTTQFLLDISSSCQHLRKIKISDFLHTSDSRPFEEVGLDEILAAGAEIHPYIKTNYTTSDSAPRNGLKNYVIQLDKLRKDRSQFQ
jgi:hypothetical protein